MSIAERFEAATISTPGDTPATPAATTAEATTAEAKESAATTVAASALSPAVMMEFLALWVL
jgi:hypothetical protein